MNWWIIFIPYFAIFRLVFKFSSLSWVIYHLWKNRWNLRGLFNFVEFRVSWGVWNGRCHWLDNRVGKNPCRKNTVSEKTLHGRHREVCSSKLCKWLIFKQLAILNFQKKDSKLRGRMLFFASKRNEPKENIYFLLFISLMLYR